MRPIEGRVADAVTESSVRTYHVSKSYVAGSYALHDVTLASTLADHVWILDEGRLAAAGPAKDVLVPDRLEPIFKVSFRRIDGDKPLIIPAPPI